MGIRSPVVIVSSVEEVEKIRGYCAETKKTEATDFDLVCTIVGIKVIDERFYICVSTYGWGLSKLRARFPDFVVTNVKSIKTGSSFFVTQGEYDQYTGTLIPNFEELPNVSV